MVVLGMMKRQTNQSTETRYQVMGSGRAPAFDKSVTNYPASQKAAALTHLAKLRKTDPTASLWDTRQNAMSSMFRF